MILSSMIAVMAMAPQATPNLKISFKSATSKVVSGVVEVSLPEGWHAYQNPPKSEYETPLKVESKTKGFKLTSVMYPKGIPITSSGSETLAYEGVVVVPFKAEIAKTLKPKAGKYEATLNVSFQICNDSSCMPPSSATAKLVWKASAK
jgi:DsbC/DsbD-like thiol-disulfide interchange protein